MRSLKSAAKSEGSEADTSAKRAKITVQNGAEVFHETGFSGNKDVQVTYCLNSSTLSCFSGNKDVIYCLDSSTLSCFKKLNVA